MCNRNYGIRLLNERERATRKDFLSFVSFHIIAGWKEEADPVGRTGLAFKRDIKKKLLGLYFAG